MTVPGEIGEPTWVWSLIGNYCGQGTKPISGLVAALVPGALEPSNEQRYRAGRLAGLPVSPARSLARAHLPVRGPASGRSPLIFTLPKRSSTLRSAPRNIGALSPATARRGSGRPATARPLEPEPSRGTLPAPRGAPRPGARLGAEPLALTRESRGSARSTNWRSPRSAGPRSAGPRRAGPRSGRSVNSAGRPTPRSERSERSGRATPLPPRGLGVEPSRP